MASLSAGDEQKIEEIKNWLKGGMEITEVREEMQDMGYNDYHIAFLLEEATGEKFLPKRPSVLLDTTKIRIAMIASLLVVLGIVVWWFFLR